MAAYSPVTRRGRSEACPVLVIVSCNPPGNRLIECCRFAMFLQLQSGVVYRASTMHQRRHQHMAHVRRRHQAAAKTCRQRATSVGILGEYFVIRCARDREWSAALATGGKILSSRAIRNACAEVVTVFTVTTTRSYGLWCRPMPRTCGTSITHRIFNSSSLPLENNAATRQAH